MQNLSAPDHHLTALQSLILKVAKAGVEQLRIADSDHFTRPDQTMPAIAPAIALLGDVSGSRSRPCTGRHACCQERTTPAILVRRRRQDRACQSEVTTPLTISSWTEMPRSLDTYKGDDVHSGHEWHGKTCTTVRCVHARLPRLAP